MFSTMNEVENVDFPPPLVEHLINLSTFELTEGKLSAKIGFPIISNQNMKLIQVISLPELNGTIVNVEPISILIDENHDEYEDHYALQKINETLYITNEVGHVFGKAIIINSLRNIVHDQRVFCLGLRRTEQAFPPGGVSVQA